MEIKDEIAKLEGIVGQLIKGDCFTPIDVGLFSETRGLAEQLKQLQSQMTSQSFEIRVASSQVASVSEKIESYLHQQSRVNQSIHQQANAIAEVNQRNLSIIQATVSEANEARAVLVESNQSTVHLAQMGEKSQTELKEQANEILNVVQHIDSIAASTEKTDVLLGALVNSSKKIVSIVDTVRKFSKQTHLVSMNASIEAARSGDKGRGFAVIADEIRRLSEESNQSVNGIYDLITDLMQAIDVVTQCNQENRKIVKETVEKSDNISRGLQHIGEMYQMVLTHIDTLAQLSERSRWFFDRVDDTVKEAAVGVNQMASGFDELQNDIVEQFNQKRLIERLKTRINESAQGLQVVADCFSMDVLAANEEQIQQTLEGMHCCIQEIAADPVLLTLDADAHKQCIDTWIETHDEIDALWSNDADGNFIYSNPVSGIENAKIRNWFNEALRGNQYTSDIYISSISKKPCITISIPIKKGNEVVGVLGADIDLQQ
jgi:methyl-accepting chemotaxis protein